MNTCGNRRCTLIKNQQLARRVKVVNALNAMVVRLDKLHPFGRPLFVDYDFFGVALDAAVAVTTKTNGVAVTGAEQSAPFKRATYCGITRPESNNHFSA